MTTRLEQTIALCTQNRSLVADTNVLIALSWRARSGWTGIGGGSGEAPRAGVPRWALAELETLVRDKVNRGVLFLLHDASYWASPATGQRRCRVCSETISQGNECEIRASRGYVYTHLICHQLWWRESESHPQ
jgi:hypothetical protein